MKTEGAIKPWKQLPEEYGLANKLKFKWVQLIHSLPKPWIEPIFIDSGNLINLANQDHHLIKKHQILCLHKNIQQGIWQYTTSVRFSETNFTILF